MTLRDVETSGGRKAGSLAWDPTGFAFLAGVEAWVPLRSSDLCLDPAQPETPREQKGVHPKQHPCTCATLRMQAKPLMSIAQHK